MPDPIVEGKLVPDSGADDAVVPELVKCEREYSFRDREIILKEREQKRLDDELQWKLEQERRSRWTNPLVIAVLGAAVAALGNAAVSWISASNLQDLEGARATAARNLQERIALDNLQLERTRAEAGRLLEVARTGDPDKAATNLQFMLDVGMISDRSIAERLRSYLAERRPGQGFALAVSPFSPLGRLSPTFGMAEIFWSRYGSIDTIENEITTVIRAIRAMPQGTFSEFCVLWFGRSSLPTVCPRFLSRVNAISGEHYTMESELQRQDSSFLRAFLKALAQHESGRMIDDGALNSAIAGSESRPSR